MAGKQHALRVQPRSIQEHFPLLWRLALRSIPPWLVYKLLHNYIVTYLLFVITVYSYFDLQLFSYSVILIQYVPEYDICSAFFVSLANWWWE